MTPPNADHPVLFFDGVCNLCNRAVQFIIRHDRQGKVHFATLQSAAGEQARQAVKAQLGYLPDSLILLDKGRYYTQSAAALRVAGYFDGGWSLWKVLLAVPAFIRNPIYWLVASKRYQWFGRQDACMLPTPELKSRFLENGITG